MIDEPVVTAKISVDITGRKVFLLGLILTIRRR